MNLKNQKGSITLFVLVSCLFFLASVACVNMYMQSKQVAIDREYRQIKANYEKDINNMDAIYEELSRKNNLVVNFGIPEFDKTRNKVLVNVFINLEYLNINTIKYGWDYGNSLSDLSTENISNWTYLEHQNGDNEFVASTEFKKGENNEDFVYYYLCVMIDKKKYCIPISDYVDDGMILHYDGINNVGLGDKNHNSNAAVWKNLCGNEYNGILSTTELTGVIGPKWDSNGLNFDGIDDWVNAGIINSNYQTIEVVFSIGEYKAAIRHIFGDKQVGGGGIAVNQNNKVYGEYYIEDGYIGNTILSNYMLEKTYSVTLTYNGNVVKCFLNGESTAQSTANGVIKSNDTIMAIGADPAGSDVSGKFFNGKIYSARVYNRAITDDEIKQNYNVDKIRFNIEED